jgi:hypothetical protein
MSRPGPPAPRLRADPPPGGPLFWTTTITGAAIVIFGLYGLLTHLAASQRIDFAKWFVGVDLAHDLVIAPLAGIIGYVATRLVRRPWRFPVQAGLFATAIVLAVGWAPLHGYGHATAPGNPSVQPLDYTSAVATVLAAVWILVAGWMIVLATRHISHRPGTNSAQSHTATPTPPTRHDANDPA